MRNRVWPCFIALERLSLDQGLPKLEVGLDLAMARLSKLFLALPRILLATAPLSSHIL
jgi:hypothetical protein